MKKSIPFILKYIIPFGLATFLLWLSTRGMFSENKATMRQALLHAKYLLIIPVFLLLLLSHWIRTLRWRQLIEPLGYKPAAFDLFCALLVGYITNQLIPRGGEIVRCTSIARQYKIPTEKLIGTIISERAIDVLSLLVLGCTVFFIQYSFLAFYVARAFTKLGQSMHHWFVMVIVLAILVGIFFLLRKLNRKASSFFSKLMKGFLEGLISIKNVSNKLKFSIYTVLMWVCYVFATWVGCFALQETRHLPIITGMTMLISGTLGIILTPGGIGAYQYAIKRTLVIYGISEEIAKASGLLLWLVQFVFTTLFGILAYIAINLRVKYYEKHSVGTP